MPYYVNTVRVLHATLIYCAFNMSVNMTFTNDLEEHASLIAIDIAIANLEKQEQNRIGVPFQREEDNINILTDLECRLNNGGLPRGKILVMLPKGKLKNLGDINPRYKIRPHFVALRRTNHIDTPATKDDINIIHGFHLDGVSVEKDEVFASDQNHDAVQCSIHGEYSRDKKTGSILFNPVPDLFPLVNYDICAPDADIQNIIINSVIIQSGESYFKIGDLRQSEGSSLVEDYEEIITPVYALHKDFQGTRSAVFGQTGMGKSNFIKTIVINNSGRIAQLIFDIQAEYSKWNKQDKNHFLANIIPCIVFGLGKQEGRDRSIIYNFYRYPQVAHTIMSKIIASPKTAHYIQDFVAVDMPSLNDLEECEKSGDYGLRNHYEKKVKIFWMILKKAGFAVEAMLLPNLARGRARIPRGVLHIPVDVDLRLAAYRFNQPRQEPTPEEDEDDGLTAPPPLYQTEDELPTVDDFDKLEKDLDILWKYYKHLAELHDETKERIFDADDCGLMGFLFAGSKRSGPKVLRPCKKYHDENGSGIEELMRHLSRKETCIINFGGKRLALDVKKVYSELITTEIFNKQSEEFNNEDLDPRVINLYYEEAHELFPRKERWEKDKEQSIYTTVSKEGRKCGIGMVYATQSVSDIDEDLLAQTQNIFVFPIQSMEEIRILGKRREIFNEHAYDITKSISKGYARIKMGSSPFVIPVQAYDFRLADPTFKGEPNKGKQNQGGNELGL